MSDGFGVFQTHYNICPVLKNHFILLLVQKTASGVFLIHFIALFISAVEAKISLLIKFQTCVSVFEQLLSSALYVFLILRRHISRPDDKPVASVRPIQSTPIPMMPRQVGVGMAGSSSSGSLPVNFLQKAGVQVQRIVTTTGNVV